MAKNYNELTSYDKKIIVEYYYENRKTKMDDISIKLNISRRAISRVLREKNINTRLKNRYVLNENYFNEINTEAKAYILGLYPNKSLTIDKIPKINKKLIRHFIRGYFDGDGSIVLSHNSSYYKGSSGIIKYIYPTYNFMILGTKAFLQDISHVTNFNYIKIRNTKTEQIKSLNICAKKEFNKIFNYLYLNSTIKLQRKYNKWNEIKSAFAAGAVKQMR